MQLATVPIALTVTGTQTLTAGSARDTAVFGPGGVQLFSPNQIPLALKTADVEFDPVVVTGIACACVRALDVEAYGPETRAPASSAAETTGSPTSTSWRSSITTRRRAALATAGRRTASPTTPNATLRSMPALGSRPPPAWRPPRRVQPDQYPPWRVQLAARADLLGGQAARGAVILRSRTQIGVLNNATNGAASCTATRKTDGTCKAPDFGDDCLPCTPDDRNSGTPNTSTTTSGTASVALYDVNNTAGRPSPTASNAARGRVSPRRPARAPTAMRC